MVDEVVLYAINYEHGWELISADKRGPIVIGDSPKGTFNPDSLIPAQDLWIKSISEEIFIRMKDESHDEKIDEQIRAKEQESLQLWKMVTCDQDFLLSQSLPETKVAPPDHSGHWELWYTYDEETEDVHPHMLMTHWFQGGNYNQFCPLKTDGSGERAPAGCAPVAAAQMLYYLHYHIGKPVSSPSAGSCVGNISSYSQSFSGFSSLTWDQMNDYYDTDYYEALLMGYIGSQSSTRYGNNGTDSNLPDYPSVVFPRFNIACTHGNYNSTTVYNSLKNQMPVIVSAYSFNPSLTNLTIFSGHAFIADKYTEKVITTWGIYRFVYDQQGVMHPLPPDNKTLKVSSSRSLLTLGFNWGYGNGPGYDDMNYSPDGVWAITDDNVSTTYRFQKKMIYGYN